MKQDPYNALHRVLRLAAQHQAHGIVTTGDFFDSNKPTTETMAKAIEVLQSKPVLPTTSAAATALCLTHHGQGGGVHRHGHHEHGHHHDHVAAPHTAVLTPGQSPIPFITTHGNHDAPESTQRELAVGAAAAPAPPAIAARRGRPRKHFSLLDTPGMAAAAVHRAHYGPLHVLQAAGLVTYIGSEVLLPQTHAATTETDTTPRPLPRVLVKPVTLVYGPVALAVFGLGYFVDSDLATLLAAKAITFEFPTEPPPPPATQWRHLLIIHQNREQKGGNADSFVPEQLLPPEFHLVLWGHEHEPRDTVVLQHAGSGHGHAAASVTAEEASLSTTPTTVIVHPGSLVATDFSTKQLRAARHVYLLDLEPGTMTLHKVPLPTRRAQIGQVDLLHFVQACDSNPSLARPRYDLCPWTGLDRDPLVAWLCREIERLVQWAAVDVEFEQGAGTATSATTSATTPSQLPIIVLQVTGGVRQGAPEENKPLLPLNFRPELHAFLGHRFKGAVANAEHILRRCTSSRAVAAAAADRVVDSTRAEAFAKYSAAAVEEVEEVVDDDEEEQHGPMQVQQARPLPPPPPPPPPPTMSAAKRRRRHAHAKTGLECVGSRSLLGANGGQKGGSNSTPPSHPTPPFK
jgi:hypothetical protein